MLHRIKALKGCLLNSLNLVRVNGDAGKLRDFYFDDLDWSLRYVVADTGNWLRHRPVLYPIAAAEECIEAKVQRWESAARLQADRAFRRHEHSPERLYQADSYELRCTHDLIGSLIQSADGDIGHADDFVIDDTTMALRYVVVNTSETWHRKQTLVSTRWIEGIDRITSAIYVKLPCATIKRAPQLSSGGLITPAYESVLTQHYRHKHAAGAF